MSDRCIIVEPREAGYFGFNVRYCSHHISLPGYMCVYKETPDWTFQLRKILPRYGCSPKQIHVILQLMKMEIDGCLVKTNADVDFFPLEEEDEEDEYDFLAREEAEEEEEEVEEQEEDQ